MDSWLNNCAMNTLISELEAVISVEKKIRCKGFCSGEIVVE